MNTKSKLPPMAGTAGLKLKNKLKAKQLPDCTKKQLKHKVECYETLVWHLEKLRELEHENTVSQSNSLAALRRRVRALENHPLLRSFGTGRRF